MKRFLIFFVLVCAMFGVMLTTIRVVGTLVPRSRAMGILKINNCGQPCVMGIILGKTTFDEAKQLLTSYQVPQGYQITVTADEIPQTSGVVGQPILNVNLFYPDGSQPVQVHFVFYGQATVQGITVFSETYSEFMPS